MRRFKDTLSSCQVSEMLEANLATNNLSGGLVFGRTFSEGGIRVLMEHAGAYRVVPPTEDLQFLVNPNATARFLQILQGLNNLVYDAAYFSKKPSIGMKVLKKEFLRNALDCHLKDPELIKDFGSRTIILKAHEDCFFVNKFTAFRHLELLHWMNEEEPYGV